MGPRVGYQRSHIKYRPHRHRLALALDVYCRPLDLATFTDVSRSRVCSLNRIVSPVRRVARLDPRGRVDGVTDHGEVEPAAAADVAGHAPCPSAIPIPISSSPPSRSRAHAVDLERGLERASAWSRSAPGSAEHGQQAVADELVDVAAVRGDHRHGELEEAVERRRPPRAARCRSASAVKSRMSTNIIVTSASSRRGHGPVAQDLVGDLGGRGRCRARAPVPLRAHLRSVTSRAIAEMPDDAPRAGPDRRQP